ncbi:MAG: glyoxalase [Rhodospirillales bacterium]|nr:glyoxalase [Rhodospirillales bacterium]
MIDHLGLAVRDVDLAKAFYLNALEPLGNGIIIEEIGGNAHIGFGSAGQPYFWIGGGKPEGPVHIAFTASSRAAVDGFHRAALAAGGTDNGAPGIRAHYHPNYYGAFAFDLDGHNVEAVCHLPE